MGSPTIELTGAWQSLTARTPMSSVWRCGRGARSWSWMIAFSLIVIGVVAVWRVHELRAERLAESKLKPDDPLRTIKVTLTVGADGDELTEPVDLHLGVGFPLRLYPVGGEKRQPGFAAIAQKTSLEKGVFSVKPGESASFEFSSAVPEGKSGKNAADALRTTPELLRDLRVADVQHVGFASLGKNNWVLKGYRIEINGEPFAENADVDARPHEIQNENRQKMQLSIVDFELLLPQLRSLEETVRGGLATDDEIVKAQSLNAKLAQMGEAINAVAASGVVPPRRATFVL